MSHTLSTIIVNYNAGPLLRKCVDSLLACPLDIEIIVVDNASSDASLDGLQDLSQVCVIRNPANMGFAAACNIGVQASSAPFLLFLNPDCFFQPDAIAPLLAGLQSGDRVGMVGGLLVNEDGTEQGGGRRAVPTPWRSLVRAFGLQRFANRWPKLFYDFHLHKQPLPDSPIEVEAISGACMLVRRDVMEDVGLWDEGYFLHCEDLDWCMRFRQNLPNTRNLHEFESGSYTYLGEKLSSKIRSGVDYQRFKSIVFIDKYQFLSLGFKIYSLDGRQDIGIELFKVESEHVVKVCDIALDNRIDLKP